MSIEKMIQEHPDVGGDYNPALGLAVKNLLDALDPETVLRRLPAPLAYAARRLMAG